jgi:hypothetical protein
MKDALQAIINELSGIAYSDLTTAEKNILRIAARGLNLTIKVVDDAITTEKK